MTLLARNNCFKAGIILAALSLSLFGLGAYLAFPAFPEASASASLRSQGIIQSYIHDLAEPAAFVPFWTILASVAYSFIAIILIYNFFKKTQCPEILFIGFFVLSMLFELARIVIPLGIISPFPSMYRIAASRVLFFGRYFGLFSLFAASVYAAKLDAQKQQNIFLILVLTTLVITLNVPIDSLSWDSTFMLWNGYMSMFLMVELGILAVTILTFFISAYTQSSRSYVYIGIGVFLLLVGRNMLIYSDTWITPVPGLIFLIVGTWLVCSRLHLEYLWL